MQIQLQVQSIRLWKKKSRTFVTGTVIHKLCHASVFQCGKCFKVYPSLPVHIGTTYTHTMRVNTSVDNATRNFPFSAESRITAECICTRNSSNALQEDVKVHSNIPRTCIDTQQSILASAIHVKSVATLHIKRGFSNNTRWFTRRNKNMYVRCVHSNQNIVGHWTSIGRCTNKGTITVIFVVYIYICQGLVVKLQTFHNMSILQTCIHNFVSR